MKKIVIFLFSLLPFLIFSQTDLVQWNGANNGFAPVVLNSTISSVNVASSGGVSLSSQDWGANVFFQTGNWPTPNQNTGSIDTSKYVQFTITATTGNQIELDDFNFEHSGAANFQVRYSKDPSFLSQVHTLISNTTTSGTWTATPSNSLSSVNPVLPGETVYIRVYAYNTWNTFHIRHSQGGATGPTIAGTVSSYSNELMAVDDEVFAEPNQLTPIDVLQNDLEGSAPISSVVLTTPPAHGTVLWNNTTKRFNYSPQNTYLGADTFTYTIANGVDPDSTATVHISVQGSTPSGALCGGYIIDADYGHFSSITNAVAHLNAHGVSCPVTFVLNDTLYANNTGEMFPIEITAAATHTVKFKPAANKNVLINAYNAATWIPVTAVFKLNGAKNILFDGSNFGSNSKNLTITNHCAIMDGSDRSVFWLTDQSDLVELKNLVLMQGNYNDDSAVSAAIFAGNNTTIHLDSAGSSNNPVSNFKVHNILFKGVKQGVFINNSDNDFSTNIQIYENDFGTEASVDKITHSVFLRGANGFVVEKNTIYDLEIDFSAGLDYSGIYVGGNSRNGIISKNRILEIHRTNASQQVAGIHLATTYADTSNIAVLNNFVTDIYSPGSHNNLSGGAYGIYLEGGKGYKIYHNSISLSDNVTDGICAAIILRGDLSNYSSLDIRNNIFNNTQTNGNYESEIRKFGIAIEGNLAGQMSTVFSHLDNNNYFTPNAGGFVGGHQSLNTSDTYPNNFFIGLTDWQNFVGADFEQNSGFENTVFVSNYNLHVNDPNAWVNNSGISLEAEFEALGLPYDDIDGQLRSTHTPDVGADEFGTPSPEPGTCEVTLYWDGTSWGDESGAPVVVDAEVIMQPTRDFKTELRAAFDTALHGSFITCELKIATGGSLRINDGAYVYVVRRLLNQLSASAVVVESNGSIIQEIDYNENQGDITFKRDTKPMYNFDYTYWGSPVSGQTTAALSAGSGSSRFRWDPAVYYSATYETYLQQGWKTHPGVMHPGQGYIIKAPTSFPSNTSNNPQVFTANFVGVPHSGPYTFDTTGDPGNNLNGFIGNNPVTGNPSGDFAWNFFANPYPSLLDVEKFRSDNDQVLGDNVYLWAHNTKPVAAGVNYAYVANDFAVYNVRLGIGTSATPYADGDTTLNPNYNVPTKYIAAGQGFFMAAKTGTVQYNNSMRYLSVTQFLNDEFPDYFYRQVQDESTPSTTAEPAEVHALKLSIRNEQGAFHQMLVGYTAGASNELDEIDGVIFGGNYVSLYSIAENTALVVQGRSLPFQDSDEVTLGYSVTLSGNFSINLDYFDGLFLEENTNQDIFLKDNLLAVVHNLRESPYEYYTEMGSFNDRFVLVYSNALNTNNTPDVHTNWGVYPKDGQLEVFSVGFDIKAIEVYDLLGRLVYQKEAIYATEHRIDKINSNQILIVKMTSESGGSSVVKIKN